MVNRIVGPVIPHSCSNSSIRVNGHQVLFLSLPVTKEIEVHDFIWPPHLAHLLSQVSHSRYQSCGTQILWFWRSQFLLQQAQADPHEMNDVLWVQQVHVSRIAPLCNCRAVDEMDGPRKSNSLHDEMIQSLLFDRSVGGKHNPLSTWTQKPTRLVICRNSTREC